jgi:hypothetical protein
LLNIPLKTLKLYPLGFQVGSSVSINQRFNAFDLPSVYSLDARPARSEGKRWCRKRRCFWWSRRR